MAVLTENCGVECISSTAISKFTAGKLDCLLFPRKVNAMLECLKPFAKC